MWREMGMINQEQQARLSQKNDLSARNCLQQWHQEMVTCPGWSQSVIWFGLGHGTQNTSASTLFCPGPESSYESIGQMYYLLATFWQMKMQLYGISIIISNLKKLNLKDVE